jgi:hypothetical protein
MPLTHMMLSRASLSAIIERHGLYPRERATQPMEDVIEGMRRDIRIEAAPDGPDLVRISFRYENAALAQRTAPHRTSWRG